MVAEQNINLNDLDVEEIEKYIQDLDEQKQAIRSRQLEAHEVLDRKNAERAVRERIERMPEAEQEAFRQILGIKGIDSAESVSGA